MKKVALFVFFCLFFCFLPAVAQMEDDDVDNLKLVAVSPSLSRLTWTAVSGVPCEFSVTYSVFRARDEAFEPAVSNAIASGLTKTIYLAREPQNTEWYYHVRAVHHRLYCAPQPSPSLRSGSILTFPLDYAARYMATIADNQVECKATSTSELACPGINTFHAVVAEQNGHEWLIGCLSEDYEDGAWSCVNLGASSYKIFVHSQTLTFFNAGFSKQSMKTGKTLSSVIPVFSNLGLVK